MGGIEARVRRGMTHSSKLKMSRSSGREGDWSRYLLFLASPASPLSRIQALRAQSLWDSLRRFAGDRLVPPHAAPLEDGTFSMAWDQGRLHFEVELQPSGAFDWFYLDRESDEVAGEEDLQIGAGSPQMIELLRRVATY